MNAHRDPSDPRHPAVETAPARPQGKRAHRRSKAASVRPAIMPPWQLLGVYWGSGVLAASGLIALLLHHFGQTQTEFGPGPNRFEHPLLAVHGAVAMAFLILLGSLLPAHILRGWQQKRNFTSGVAMIAVQALLILTAYGLYYASGDGLRAVVSLVHWLVGLLVFVVLPWHVITGRRRAVR